MKLGIRFKPELFRLMDAYLSSSAGAQDTQRSLVERALQRELDRLKPKESSRERHSSRGRTRAHPRG